MESGFDARAGADLRCAFSRRLIIQQRLVYPVLEDEKLVKILRLWTHDD